jgi:aflatoxin B1 aldehyde reductase
MDTEQARRYRGRYFRDACFEAVQAIEGAISPFSLSIVEASLRWLVHHSELRVAQERAGNDGVIIGISSLEQLRDNLGYLEKGPLPDKVVEALDEAWHIVKANCPDYWHGELKYAYHGIAGTAVS